jgi:hypothetical protein
MRRRALNNLSSMFQWRAGGAAAAVSPARPPGALISAARGDGMQIQALLAAVLVSLVTGGGSSTTTRGDPFEGRWWQIYAHRGDTGPAPPAGRPRASDWTRARAVGGRVAQSISNVDGHHYVRPGQMKCAGNLSARSGRGRRARSAGGDLSRRRRPARTGRPPGRRSRVQVNFGVFGRRRRARPRLVGRGPRM